MKSRIEVDLGKVVVDVEGLTDADLIAAARLAVIEKISKDFPNAKYKKLNADGLLYDDVSIGMIVELDSGLAAIVTNKLDRSQTVHVKCENGVSYGASASALKSSDMTFEEIHERLSKDELVNPLLNNRFVTEGTTGYVKTKEGYVPVVVGKVGKANTKAFIVGERDSVFKLKTAELKRIVRLEPK